MGPGVLEPLLCDNVPCPCAVPFLWPLIGVCVCVCVCEQNDVKRRALTQKDQ